MKTAKELGITPTQRRNIARLTLFVKDSVPPPKFNIGTHHSVAAHPAEATYECGTAACFCGYGPLAGIKPRNDEGWFDYAGRAMGQWAGSSEWKFLFDDQHKNSKAAAVLRGAWYLMNGVPEDKSPSTWEAPRSFKPDWKAIAQIASL